MAAYVGEIKINTRNGFYVNFYPGYLYHDQEFDYLTRQDLEVLLPNSVYQNINLVSSSSLISLEDIFQDGDDFILDFDTEDLLPNCKIDGTRYPSAWKLDIAELYGRKIRRMEELGCYCLVDRKYQIGDWRTDNRIEIDSNNINENMEVLLACDIPNVVIGPFKVHYDEINNVIFVRCNADAQNKVIRGYQFTDGLLRHSILLEQEDVTRTYLQVGGENVEPYIYDEITISELVEDLRTLTQKRMSKNYRFNEDSARHMVEVYQNWLLSPNNFSQEAAEARKNKLFTVLKTKIDFDETLDMISKLAGELFVQYKDDPVYATMIDALAHDDHFLHSIDSFKPLYEQKTELEEQVADLKELEQDLRTQVSELATLEASRKIENYRNSLAELQRLQNQAEDRLKKTLKTANLASEVEQLEKQSSLLRLENERMQKESDVLKAQLRDLDNQVDQLLERSANKALEMSVDHIISQRIGEQSEKRARLLLEQSSVQAARLINALPVSVLDPESMVNLLVHNFAAYRPDYSRNEILNIIICLHQSFMTLFTGPVGSGKSSTLEIVREVLNLEKPRSVESQYEGMMNCSRFVRVQVERGWVNSRDFIGFYNSLTHSFEKMNPQLFDLLSILNIQSRNLKESMLPALIMLDDANLSHMEYYWSDFMAMQETPELVLDEGDKPHGFIRGTLKLGENYNYQIPDALHFAATIQTDQSFEPISARLLDRAFVINMPDHPHQENLHEKVKLLHLTDELFNEEQLARAFNIDTTHIDLASDLESVYQNVCEAFAQAGTYLSRRSDQAIRRYILNAARWFDDETDEEGNVLRNSALIALDFAILQRMMTQINGTSIGYRNALVRIGQCLETNHLTMSKAKLDAILRHGDESMQYYQYFEQ